MILFDEKNRLFYSSQLHFRHGFLTRAGTEHIPGEITAHDFFWVHQVHSNAVLVLNDEKDFGRVTTKDADGIIYRKIRSNPVTLSVRTADCVPIMLEDRKHQIAGIVHSGWKGTWANVLETAVRKMLALGSRQVDICAVIGPAIGSCCYSIDERREKIFSDQYQDSIEKREGKTKFNLVKSVFTQLTASGISPDSIDWKFFCTQCQEDLFSSYRRDGKGVANMISYITI